MGDRGEKNEAWGIEGWEVCGQGLKCRSGSRGINFEQGVYCTKAKAMKEKDRKRK